MILWFEGTRGRALWDRSKTYVATALPVYLFFGVLDRLYQIYRFGFGSVFVTYVTVIARETKMRNPSLPPNYPFETPWHVGFFGALFTPEKSIFLFDPLIVLMILLCIVAWKRFSPAVKAYAVMSCPLLLGVHELLRSLYGLEWRLRLGRSLRFDGGGIGLVSRGSSAVASSGSAAQARVDHRLGIFAAGIFVQLVSLAFWLSLELYQMETLGHPTFVIALRVKNIIAFALGKMDAWGLNNHAMTEDPWDYAHITEWNFLPFVLRRVGVAPAWVVNLTLVVWYAGLAALAATLWQLRRVLSRLPQGTSLAS